MAERAMSDMYDKTRLLVAKREDEDYPMVIAAMAETTWEIIPVEDWDEWKRKRAEEYFDSDWTAYDYIEVVITIPNADLLAMFMAREITPASVEVASDA
jgi:hypothetical protein